MSPTDRNRFQEIADRLLPAGVRTVYERPKNNDRAGFDYRNGVVHAPQPIDRQALWDFLHECAHGHLHWDRLCRRKQTDFADGPQHVTEYECERWTFYRFRDADLLSDDMIIQSSEYLMREILKDRRVIADRGLHQPALDHLLRDHRAEVERRLEEHIRELTWGLSGRDAIIPYIGRCTPQEELVRPPN